MLMKLVFFIFSLSLLFLQYLVYESLDIFIKVRKLLENYLKT